MVPGIIGAAQYVIILYEYISLLYFVDFSYTLDEFSDNSVIM